MSSDPYVYPGTTVLKNIPGIRNQRTLDRFEADRVVVLEDGPDPRPPHVDRPDRERPEQVGLTASHAPTVP